MVSSHIPVFLGEGAEFEVISESRAYVNLKESVFLHHECKGHPLEIIVNRSPKEKIILILRELMLR